MRLTNKLNLPQPIVKAVANDSYTKGDADISVTELLDPPHLRQLKAKHYEELEEDVSERIWSLCGQVIHGILERAEEVGIAEKRWDITVDGWKISGGMDRLVKHDGLLQDYKFTTVYKVRDGKAPEDWVKQLNIYKYMLGQHGIVIKSLQIVAILRDWSKLAVLREEVYPPHQVSIIDVPIIPDEEILAYIKERVAEHKSTTPPVCSKEERWAKNDVYAIKKVGRKSSVRNCDTREAAETIMNGLGPGHSIEHREGKSVRCESYCLVSKFCTFYQKSIKNEE